MEEEIRIYVACLAAYNNGYLHGRWIDAQQGIDHVWGEVQAMLASSPIEDAEEWAIHDYEGFESVSLSEWESFESVVKTAEFIVEYGKLGAELILYCGNIEEAKATLEERYAGEYQSVSDFVQEMTEQTIEIPENVSFYIDWEAMARDWEISDILTIHIACDEVHVFWQH